MKDPKTYQIQTLLPELFSATDQGFKPDGMCTPESGCAPDVRNSQMDLLKILTGSGSTPLAPKEGAGNQTMQHIAAEAAGQRPK